MQLMLSHPHVFWITLGGLLLVAEMLGTSGYLLWSGIAAVITGMLIWILPVSWQWQGISFASLTLITTFLWWRFLSRRSQLQAGHKLNQRGHQFVGHRLRLDTALYQGRGHIRIADSSWPVEAPYDLESGAEIIVTAIEGITLKVVRATDDGNIRKDYP